jgi:hypothetical protein
VCGRGAENVIHDGISLVQFVIPGLTRNPVFLEPFWIPACTGMTVKLIFQRAKMLLIVKEVMFLGDWVLVIACSLLFGYSPFSL